MLSDQGAYSQGILVIIVMC